MSPTLRIELLGEFRLLFDEQIFHTHNKPRLQALLAYLLLHRHEPRPRQQIAFAFWPDSSEGQAYTNLRKLFFQLRQTLPEADTFLAADTLSLGWRSDAFFTLDVAEVEQALDHLENATTPAPETMERVISLYRGELLPTCYDDWILPIRRALHERVVNALERALVGLEAQHEYQVAMRTAEHLLRLDPLHEATYRHLMRLRALKGDRAGALRIYLACATVLQQELDVSPTSETQALYEQLRKAEPRPSTSAVPIPASAPSPPQAEARPLYTHLPSEPTPLIGREQEVIDLKALLCREEVRLVTVVGPPGAGKTHLSLHVARNLDGNFAARACLLALAPINDITLIVPTLAHILSVTVVTDQPLVESLKSYLRDKQMLLLLDNFEHVMAAAPLVSQLLAAASRLKILVTSRERLNLLGEHQFVVHPLALPALKQLPPVDGLAQVPAVALFVQRARAVRRSFTLNQENSAAVAGLAVCTAGRVATGD